MECFKSAFDHICLLPVRCIKCYCIHDDESDGRSAKCPLCDIIFYSKICWRDHFSHMLTIRSERGEHQKSCRQVFKYCDGCYGIVKQREWIKGRWHEHDCCKVYYDCCEGFKQNPHLCYVKSIHLIKSSSLCERIFFFDFETHCDGFNTCFEVYYCVVDWFVNVAEIVLKYFQVMIAWIDFVNICLKRVESVGVFGWVITVHILTLCLYCIGF